MQSMFDERIWLAWLVKVRILILTFLLGIELAIARLTPSPFPLRLFVGAILLWYAVICCSIVLLLSFWEEHRIQSLLQVVTDLLLVTPGRVCHRRRGQFAELSLSAGHHRCLHPVAAIVGVPDRGAGLHPVRRGSGTELLRSDSFVLDTRIRLGRSQAIIFVNLFGYLAVAYLAGLLAAKLRQVDVQLKDTSGALEDLQALHENIIQSISGGLITTGLDGHITLVNTAAQKLLERSETEF